MHMDGTAIERHGEELYRRCRGKLDAAEGKIEELARRVEGARPDDTPPFTDSGPSA